MNIKSVILGLLAAVLMCMFCYINDNAVRCGTMIPCLLPAVAYGGLVFFVLLINPLLRLCGRNIALNKLEVAAVLALFLISCGIPGWSFGEMFPGTVMFPHHDNRTTPAWSSMKILELAPHGALCDVSGPKGEDVALNGFVTGLGEGNHFIRLSDVPWFAWKAPFLFWGPIVFSFLLAVFGLAVVFHKQWSSHEQLPYPIIQFTSALLPTENGGLPAIFRNRMFLIGFIICFLIYFNNYGVRWFPQYFIPVQTNLNMGPFSQLFPTILRGKGSMLFYPRIIMTVIGLAYFLPSEASFTMWVGPWIYCLIGGIFAAYGTDLRAGKMMALVPEPFIFAGGYFGLFLIIFYTGRHFYLNTFKKALFFHNRENIPAYAVHGMRLFLVCFIAFIVFLHLAGIHWTVGLIYAFMAVMVYAVVSRVLAETGAFEIGTYVYPCVFLWGVMGASSLGPRVLLFLFMLSTVLLAAPGWCIMPFINHSLKLAQNAKLSVGKTSFWGMITVIVAIVVTIPATIYWQYNVGANPNDWPRASSRYPFANAVEVLQTLRAQGLEEAALLRSGFDHILNLNPDWTLVFVFVITTIITICIAMGRLKYTWWPLHPVICIFFGGHQGMVMSASFGIGFLLKVIITKYGGGKMYQDCKPLFIGVIAGTLFEEIVQMLIGAGYYFITGTTL